MCEVVEALTDAASLLNDIMRDDCNAQDEAEKWLRAYAPQYLKNAKLSRPEGGKTNDENNTAVEGLALVPC